MLALQSCKGSKPNTCQGWCCTKRQCSIQYTVKEIYDLGFSSPLNLKINTSNQLQLSTATSRGQSLRVPSPNKPLLPVLVSRLAAIRAVALNSFRSFKDSAMVTQCKQWSYRQ
jgi:hypothetical protein